MEHCLKGKKKINLMFSEAGCQRGTAGVTCHQKITGESKPSKNLKAEDLC